MLIRPLGASTAAALLLTLAAPSGQASPSATPSWSGRVTIGQGESPSVAVGHGTTTVVWSSPRDSTEGGPIRVRRHVKGKTWGPVRQLGFGTRPVVATNPANLTVAAWVQPSADGPRVMVARRPPKGSWTGPRMLRQLPAQRRVDAVHLAVGDAGTVAVWWDEIFEELDPPHWNWAYVSLSTPSGAWSLPHLLVDRQRTEPGTTVAIGRRGDLDAVYAKGSGLWSIRRGVSGEWSAPKRLTARGTGEHVLLRRPGGDMVVVAWIVESGIEARRRIGGRWGSTARWRTPVTDLAATMGGAGNATIAWVTMDTRVRARSWPRGRPIGPASTLIQPTTRFSRASLQIAAGSAGTILGYVDLGIVYSQVRTMFQPRHGKWGPEQVLGAHINYPAFDLAVRPSGAVEAAWLKDWESDPNRQAIRHSTFN